MRREIVPRIVVSVGMLGVCLFVTVSLLTYSAGDLGVYSLPEARPVHNQAGIVGAHLASFLLEGLGVCSGFLIVFGLMWSVLNVLGKGTEQIVTRVAGALLLLVCACTFANGGTETATTMPGYGGSVGVALSGLLVKYFGPTGQWLLGTGISLMALLMLSVDELVAPPVEWLGREGKKRLGPLLKRPKRRAKKTRGRKAKPPVAERRTAETASAVDEPTHDATETVDTAEDTPFLPFAEPPAPKAVEEPVDTGRPVTAGYLNNIMQKGGTEATSFTDEAPTEESEVDDLGRPSSPSAGAQAATYVLPPGSLLDEASGVDRSLRVQHIQEQIEVLERTLGEFHVGAKVVNIDQGPVVTRYELTLDAGTKLTKVTSLSDDLAIATKAPAVRIVAPIPGKSTVGVELPNMDKEVVRMRELVESDAHRKRQRTIPLFLGKDASGEPIIGDLTRMPHLLLAGATGSGKSVCINSIISSILLTHHPDDVRLILIDPKMVELSAYAELPHLLTPVVTDMKRAAWILDWATRVMDERYDMLASVGVRSIAAYNRLGEEEIRARLGEDVDYDRIPFHLPYIIIIVDELADMMMLASKNIETSITRLAQKSRAVGLHVVLATQRPSVDVITGLIKSNLPTRISFQVTSKVDSRTILDRNGAEKLLGCGDMLFMPPGASHLVRAQGTFMSDEEILRIVDFIKRQRKPDFSLNIDGFVTEDGDETSGGGMDGYSGDDLYEQACRIVLGTGRGSVSLLQRKLEIGYTRAARLVDMMAAEGVVGDYKGSKAREVVMTLDDWENRRSSPRKRSTPTVDEHMQNLDAAADNDSADD